MSTVPKLPSPKPYAPRSHTSVTIGGPGPAPRFDTAGLELEPETIQLTSPDGIVWLLGVSSSPVDAGDTHRAFPDVTHPGADVVCLSDATIDGLIDTINRCY